MRNHKTHEFITRNLFPFIDASIINNVDKALDNPSGMDVWFSEMQRAAFGKALDIPTMFKGGHRTVNHDLLSAMWKGFQVGGTDGVYTALSHLMADTLKDNMNRQFGIYGADMLESMLLFMQQQNRR